MTHFGIISPAAIGHLNPMCALGRELERRGDRVTIFGVIDIESTVKTSGLDFYRIGEREFPEGTLKQKYQKLGQMTQWKAYKYTLQCLQEEAMMFFDCIPKAIETVGVEAVLVDQVSTAGGTICDYLNIPFVTVCNALLINREAGVPPYFSSQVYSKSPLSRLRNQIGNFIINRMSLPIWNTVVKQRKDWKLQPYYCRDDAYSKLAQICQLPAEYDFPRVNLPKHFHYTGPLKDPSGLEPILSESISFPFEKLTTDKPLIYASLGTLQNRKWEIFQTLAEACVDLDAQLVISLGNPDSKESGSNLPGSPIVVPYAPHQKLIEKSSLVITHAGMNTTLGALSSGVPILAIPITNEQPGIAARIVWTGAGEAIPVGKLTVDKLHKAVKKVLTEDSYKKNALRLKEAIRQAGGVKRAADIVEKALATRQPVY